MDLPEKSIATKMSSPRETCCGITKLAVGKVRSTFIFSVCFFKGFI